jgi:SEC-C motif-containing protein
VNQRYCPCGSQQNYLLCCAPFHKGKIVSNATQLLRARFSAYALNLPRFIIETTHPDNPQYQRDFRDWEKKISSFSSDFLFEGVEILDIEKAQDETTIRFIAHLKKGSSSASFIEKSLFVKLDGRWVYRSGIIEDRIE